MPGLGGWFRGAVLDCAGFATRTDDAEAAPLENRDRPEICRTRVSDDTDDFWNREGPRHKRLNELGCEPEGPRLWHDGVADFDDTVSARWTEVAARADKDCDWRRD